MLFGLNIWAIDKLLKVVSCDNFIYFNMQIILQRPNKALDSAQWKDFIKI
jgi:hypothetical protein